jgi:hypothetical protein
MEIIRDISILRNIVTVCSKFLCPRLGMSRWMRRYNSIQITNDTFLRYLILILLKQKIRPTLVQTSSYWVMNYFFVFTKQANIKKEVNCTEPSLSVGFLWNKYLLVFPCSRLQFKRKRKFLKLFNFLWTTFCFQKLLETLLDATTLSITPFCIATFSITI